MYWYINEFSFTHVEFLRLWCCPWCSGRTQEEMSKLTFHHITSYVDKCVYKYIYRLKENQFNIHRILQTRFSGGCRFC